MEFVDLGCENHSSVDYPDYAHLLCKFIKENSGYFGVLICGSGVGMSITANRYSEIRAALCSEEVIARLSREHNDANVLVIGARFTKNHEAIKMLQTFCNTEFSAGRHKLRLNKI